ncbi:membrane hypothetical protein [uncultured delta proteobacterium]|uniref:DUF1468 domain-containing protein n=1 Tax=uncultured delta proteobacterium TaxID=34034 RepID=A0A212JJE7_9DELT|nr:membrane hypothetical protein [uncultured delta proteobacterium]
MSTPTPSPKKLNTDLFGGFILLGMAAFFHFQMDPDFSPLAAYFPEHLIIGLVVLGVALLIKAYVRPVYMDSFVHKLNAPVVFTIIVALAWAVLMIWIGFIITSLAAIFLILWRLEPKAGRTPKRLAMFAAIAAIEVGVIHVVFVILLQVTMPVGRLWG